jgi:hypothetical protein
MVTVQADRVREHHEALDLETGSVWPYEAASGKKISP